MDIPETQEPTAIRPIKPIIPHEVGGDTNSYLKQKAEDWLQRPMPRREFVAEGTKKTIMVPAIPHLVSRFMDRLFHRAGEAAAQVGETLHMSDDQRQAEKQLLAITYGETNPIKVEQLINNYAKDHPDMVAFGVMTKKDSIEDAHSVNLRDQASVDEESNRSVIDHLGPKDRLPFALTYLSPAPVQDKDGEWLFFPKSFSDDGHPNIEFVAEKEVEYVKLGNPSKTN